MTPPPDQPCRHGLTPACFRQEPQWAKSAFALRLLHTILPPELSKRLPSILQRPLIAPGVILPPGFDPATLPPGTIITQETDFPTDWTTGDPMPPGVILPPTIPPLDAPIAPPHLSPAPGGDTPPTAGKQPSPSVDYWFYEPFDDLATNSWSDISHSGGSAAIAAAALKLKATFPGAYSAVQRTHATAWPTNWTFEFSLNYHSGTGKQQIELYTGTYRARSGSLEKTPPSGSCQATVANYLNQVNTWKLVVTGSTATLYQNNTPVITACSLFLYSFYAGRMEVEADDVHEAYIDYMTIVED
ncbi:hypothetical protein ES703_73936 [subsurface metagenome]